MKLYHDSRSLDCRAPFGAVRCGDIVRLRVYCQGRPRAVNAVITLNNQPYTIPLQPDGRDGYELRFAAPATPRLLWYYFAAVMENGQTEYLGNARDGLGGVGETYASAPPSFQLTVYARDYAPPAFLREGVMYQIFPDRFCRSRAPRYTREDIYLHENWDEAPLALFDPRNGDTHSRDFFGGDLQGIISKLDYLQSLHVTVLYLNPIFLARSNHRYDTGDYTRIDPMLGTQADLTRLCEEAAKRGMRVLLDGVFNHTGDDSLYFNRYGRYDSVGAYQSPDSPYAGWFTFERFPDKYKCWWGVDTLPEVNKDNEDYRRFILAEDGVARRWMRAGTAGWRLDVADELPTVVRTQDAQAALLGEVWEDASNKVSYGAQRCYCLGDTLDSVMNYPLRDALIAFLMAQKDAAAVAKELSSLAQNYPKPFLYALMNLMGSHDRPRILNVLAGNDGSDIPRSQRADHRLSQEERMIGALREQLMLRFVFSVPGMPCIYYGDEAGVEGCADPFCRRTYPWGREDQDMLARYKAMAAMRNGHPVLKTGECAYIAPCSAVLGVIRKNENGKDAFGKKAENACAVTLINRSAREVVVYLTSADVSGAQTLVSDDGQIFTARSGAFSVKIKGLQGVTMFAM